MAISGADSVDREVGATAGAMVGAGAGFSDGRAAGIPQPVRIQAAGSNSARHRTQENEKDESVRKRIWC